MSQGYCNKTSLNHVDQCGKNKEKNHGFPDQGDVV